MLCQYQTANSHHHKLRTGCQAKAASSQAVSTIALVMALATNLEANVCVNMGTLDLPASSKFALTTAADMANVTDWVAGNSLADAISAGLLYGRCDCERGFTGEACKKAATCNMQIADWWTQFDGAGWGLCPKGSLLQGLYRNDCNPNATYRP